MVPLLALLLVGCREPLQVQENFDFSIDHMPYFTQVKVGSHVEIRCRLNEEARFIDRTYTVRHFPYSGRGKLRVGFYGEAMQPNDRYPLYAGEFKLYYTPETLGQHDLELVVESSDGVSQTLTIRVTASENGFVPPINEGGLPSDGGGESKLTKLEEGKPYIGSNGNYWINGQDSGVKVPGEYLPKRPIVVEGENGHFWIEGQDSGVKVPEGQKGKVPVVTIGGNGNYHLDGQDTGVKVPAGSEGKAPKVTEGSNGNYLINNQDSGITAPYEPKEGSAVAVEGSNGKYIINGQETPINVPPKQIGREPQVKEGRDGNYVIDGNRTSVPVPKEPNSLSEVYKDESKVFEDIIIPDPKMLGHGEVQVILVSKGRPMADPKTGEMRDTPGVREEDGGALYRVYDQKGKPVPHARVAKMPRLEGKKYQANKDGIFFVPREDLPSKGDALPGRVEEVHIGGKVYQSDERTLVPNQLILSARYSHRDKDGNFRFHLVAVGAEDSGQYITSDYTLEKYAPYLTVYSVTIKKGLLDRGGLQYHLFPMGDAFVQVQDSWIIVKPPVTIVSDPTGISALETTKLGTPFFLALNLSKAPYGNSLSTFPELLGLAPSFDVKRLQLLGFTTLEEWMLR